MGILKKGSYGTTPVSSLTYSNVDLSKKDNTENLKFSKEEYLALMEEAKEIGYKEGLEKGYTDGYKQGVDKFEEEKGELYALLDADKEKMELDKENLKSFLEIESFNYINKFQSSIQNLIFDSINKVFFNTLEKEDVLKAYVEKLVIYLNESFEEYSITVNEKTLSTIVGVIDENKGSYKIDNILKDFDILVFANNEYKEYFLKDEFNKIKELFN